ncbi:MAG: hypothetical protein QM756_40260 [Polyangiaceae bacterium]
MRIKSLHRSRTAGVLAALSALAFGATAQAQTAPDCSTLTNPVYVAGSSAAKPFLKALATQLIGLTGTDKITLVYVSKGSCDGVNALATPTTLVTGTASIWSDAGVETAGGCNLPTAGAVVDIGISDVFAASCGVTTLASGVKDFLGPVQSMTFVVPKKSTQTAISAEAAYLTFGLGADGDTPWSDPTKYFVRTATSGTQQMLATAIKVPAAKWAAPTTNQLGSSTAVRDAVNAAQNTGTQGDADLTIGILAADVVEANRASLRVLPYQHFGQTCGYLPDSTSESADKQNTRDGHYMVWGPLHLLTRTTAGVPTNANAKKVIDILTGAVVPTFDLIAEEAKVGVVPDCAMRVSRDSEVGPLASYMPAHSCECKFVNAATGKVPAGCTACTSSATCPASAPACNYGFCEVR